MVMPHRQSYKKQTLPKVWLMTDPRLGDGLDAAVRKLPMRSGVVFRHYDLHEVERRALYKRIARICRQRGHVLILAGLHDWNAEGVHGKPRVRKPQILTTPVHSVSEIRQAQAMGADLMFLSPLFPTRSHSGARALGLLQFSRLAKLADGVKVIALGGMTRNKAQAITRRVAYGWAAIDAFAR